MNVFLKPSSRGENDAANKSREEFLASLWAREPLDEDERGLQEELRRSLHLIAPGEYTKVELIRKGGRGYNYDFDAVYTGGTTKKIEFKYGCSSLDKLPQFLSLSVKQFLPEFIPFWWSRLEDYIACDEGITCPKPSLEEYTQGVVSIQSAHPFFQQLKEREHVSKREKHKVVNDAIRDFLQPIQTVPMEYFQQRVAEQQDKCFFLWNKKMTVDGFREQDVRNLQFHSVTKNCILITSDGAMYKLLLRWRNHKGILNPAWQISVKRKL